MHQQSAEVITGQAIGWDSIERTLRLACTSCRAPGVFFKRLTESEISSLPPLVRDEYAWRLNNWPAVFVDDDRAEKPIDDRCPCCGTSRPVPIELQPWKKEAVS